MSDERRDGRGGQERGGQDRGGQHRGRRAGGARGGGRGDGRSHGERAGGDGSRRGPRQRSAQRPAERARRGDPARDTAYLVLRAVERDGAYANLELPKALREARLRGRDAAFATELVYGTLRMQGLYDAILSAAADRPADQVDGHVRDVLRLGTHQLLAMRVPDHAAVSATVALARQHVSQGAGGFVNAVLRRVSERSREEWVETVTAGIGDPVARLALEHSHPEWVVRALRAALIAHGSTAEQADVELPELLAAHNAPGPLTLVARPGLVADAALEEAGATPSPVAPTAWSLPAGDPGVLSSVRDGRAAVQDAGSQLLTLALAEAPLEGRDERWLDLCAGPGGKAGLLAALALQRGASLRANEVTPHRAELVRHTLQGALDAGARVAVTVDDGRDVGAQEPGAYDRVLVDAPCTGLGALRRRPESRWRRSPQDLSSLGPLQRELLDSAVEAVRPGGLVAYSTCSPHIGETTLVVNDLLKRRDDVELLDVRPLLRDRSGTPLPGTGGEGEPWAQLWSHRHDTDGMFVALLRRRLPSTS
ncbi:RsmB/NOP family class I SAM-dependent RNA methyltransferase [Ornithinimicrobium tianjinense]|uniref:rRNA cytosine-C5-methyltransferase n=1 Tax=Ornithinimicrobium tianjinense TaxID=1195761 RepID=A0A917F6G7_9MICO|nr:transcription antitermination factor NusB [Ornithinimicrobium tianjinense]GGF48353.1 rRNA cytosine-C5-methyltransferase [Ornithinimicrobium tianjinense]